ncbi:MAG: hypothetical protein HRJ53_19235 [Acidobacteria bacterium Pan2503]|uniref:Uncharacterized protein n=1 Tax=Candidatus Acidiferrum panamense TaxID=2741543 RepID=A0A7V8NTB7_9BACT|nr:hypothetical protein [Candidatus Acidoferrum panamensis]
MTANDCALVNLHIARRYRGGKPRQYWPFGVITDLNNTKNWNTSFQTAVNNAMIALNSAAIAMAWTGGNIAAPVNVSYYHGFTVVTNPITGRARNVPKLKATPDVDTITGQSCNQRVATQRRRQGFSV